MKRTVLGVGNAVIGVLLIVISLYPVVWFLVISLQPEGMAYQLPTRWLFVPDLSNYRKLLSDPAFIAALINSIQLSVITTALCVVLGTMAAYALARYRVRGATGLTATLALSRLLPSFAIVIPTFYLYRQLHLLDTMAGLIAALVAFQLPLAVLVMHRVINGIPVELDEAARLDGAGFLRILLQVVLPLIRPGIAASAVVTFVLIWNEFLFVLVLAGNRVLTIPMVVAMFQTDKKILWGSIAAASTISTIPIVLLVMFAQRHLLEGLGMGGVRE